MAPGKTTITNGNSNPYLRANVMVESIRSPDKVAKKDFGQQLQTDKFNYGVKGPMSLTGSGGSKDPRKILKELIEETANIIKSSALRNNPYKSLRDLQDIYDMGMSLGVASLAASNSLKYSATILH